MTNLKKQIWLKWKLLLGSLFFLQYMPDAFRYSCRRDRIERQATNPFPVETLAAPGNLLRVEPTPRGATLTFDHAELDIAFLLPDLVRVNWKPGIPPVPYGIDRHEWETVQVDLKEVEDGWMLGSIAANQPTLTVKVSKAGHLWFLDETGQVLREELPPRKPDRGWTHQAKLRPEEHIYGLGERAVALNLRQAKETNSKGEPTERPRALRMWNFDAAGKYGVGADPLYLGIPVYLGLRRAVT